MKLCDVEPNSVIILMEETSFAIASLPVKPGTKLFFKELDCMYAHCTDSKGNIIYPLRNAEVEVCDYEEP